MKLTISEVKTFRPVKYFKENCDKINSLSYTDNGEAIISSSDDDQMIMYDCNSGTPKRTINSKKYGVNLIQFTHSPTTAIHASTKIDDTIRYLSLHDNKYIRYFQSHVKRVVSLCMSPIDDTFLSGALDGTVRLWDLRSQNCHGVMHVPGRPTAAFDPDGLIFAAGINSECLKLYDLRSFDKGPFATFKLTTVEAQGIEWTSLKFSPDGKTILICTNGNFLRLVDAFSGVHLHTLTVANNTERQTLDACFTPTSQFVISTAPDAFLQVWSVETGGRVAALPSFEAASQMTGPSGVLNCVAFNPRFAMLATGSVQTSFWLPNIDAE
uniref:WD repeat containing protein 82 n=1 Tax=Echinococcus canadensis TaxID=519352 RepID=A0A915EXN0_9CEST